MACGRPSPGSDLWQLLKKRSVVATALCRRYYPQYADRAASLQPPREREQC